MPKGDESNFFVWTCALLHLLQYESNIYTATRIRIPYKLSAFHSYYQYNSFLWREALDRALYLKDTLFCLCCVHGRQNTCL